MLVEYRLRLCAQSQIVQEKVIDAMSGCNGIETDHTWVWFLNAVLLRLSLFIRLGLFGKRRWINELITPEASATGAYRSIGAHHIG